MKRGGIECVAALFFTAGCSDRAAQSNSPMPPPAVVVRESRSFDSSAAERNEWGSIKGRLVWGKPDLPKRIEIDVVKDKEFCSADGPLFEESVVVDESTRGIKNVFVYLLDPTAIHPSYPQTKDEVRSQDEADFNELNGADYDQVSRLLSDKKIAIEGIRAPVLIRYSRCRYRPHAMAMREGQIAYIARQDPIAHYTKVTSFRPENSYSSIPFPVELESYAWVADRQPLNVQCSIHGWMQMWVMVFEHPYFAVTGSDGAFELKNVPAGELNLMIRTPRFIDVNGGKGNAKGSPVTVKPGETLDLGDIKVTAFD